MNKEIIFVNDDNENLILNKLYSLIENYKKTCIEISQERMNIKLNLKSQKRKFIELLFEKNGLAQELENLTQNCNYVLRTIVKNKNNKFKESLTWIPIFVNEMSSDIEWLNSTFYESLNQKIILVVFKEINEKETFIDDFFVISFDEIDKLNAKSVFYQTQIKFNNGGILTFDPIKNRKTYNFVKPNVDEYFHVRPKAKDSKDVYKTQYGEIITKQAFWLNKSTLEMKLDNFHKVNDLITTKYKNTDVQIKEQKNNEIFNNFSNQKNILIDIKENFNFEDKLFNNLNKKKRNKKIYQDETIIKWLFEQNIDDKNIFFKNKIGVILEDINIDSYDFSVRTKNALINSNIRSFKKIVNLRIYELKSIENLGEKSINEIFLAILETIYFDKSDYYCSKEVEKKINYFVQTNHSDLFYNKQLLINILCRYSKYIEINDISLFNINKLLTNCEEWKKYVENFILNKINDSDKKFIDIKELNDFFTDFNVLDINQIISDMIISNRIINKESSLFIVRENVENIIFSNADDVIKLILEKQINKISDEFKNYDDTNKMKNYSENNAYKLRIFFDTINDFDEIWFSRIFETYNFNFESFNFITGWNEIVYVFFKYKYNQGNKNILSLCYDNNAPSFVKERAITYREKYWLKTTDGDLVFKRRNDIFWYLIKKNGNQEIKFEHFYTQYNSFLKENNLLNDEYKYSKRILEAKISTSDDILWKYKKIFRYFEFDSINKNEFINDLNLEKFNNKEIDTIILLNNTNIKEKYNIRDEYELHNFLKKICKNLDLPFKISFNRMPCLGIGSFDRNEQIKKLLFAEAPINKEKFAELYSEIYGVKKQNVLGNYLGEISKYLNGNIFEIDYIPFNDVEFNLIKTSLNKRYYNLEEIEEIYLTNFPDGDIKKINKPNLDSIGFKISGEHVYKKEFQNLEAVFRSYFTQTNKIVRVDINFNINAAQNTREQILSDYKWLQIDKETFISNELLFKNTEMNTNDIYDFCEKAIEFSNNKLFTIASLIKKGFEHKLLDLGFDDYFYESILKRCKKICFGIFGKGVMFRKINNDKKTILILDLITEIIDEKISIDIYDLIHYIEINYNIYISKQRIIISIKDSLLYYDETFEKVYIDKNQFLEEII